MGAWRCRSILNEIARLFLLLLVVTVPGWSIYRYFDVATRPRFEKALFLFVCGMALVSVAAWLLMEAGFFKAFWLVCLLLIVSVVPFLVRFGKPGPSVLLPVAAVLIFAGLIRVLATVSPAYDAELSGEDASLYIATAAEIANTGRIQNGDPLVSAMAPEERLEIFHNRFLKDTTGPWMRFPGGVRMPDPGSGNVTFSFYHLFPLWLATGIQFLGQQHYLAIMSLFLSVSILIMVALGRMLAGTLAGIFSSAILFVFLPQQYFSRMLFSELPAQAFFLSGLAVIGYSLFQDKAPEKKDQILTGLLWGCLFLTRLDTLFVTVASLILAFAFIPSFYRNIRALRFLLKILAIFILLAFYHQVFTGEYSYLFPSAVYMEIHAVVQAHHAASLAAVILAACFILWIPVPEINNRVSTAAIRLPAMAAGLALILLWIGPEFQWQSLQRTLGWLSAYFPWWILVLQSACVVYLFATMTNRRSFVLLCFIFVIVSAVSFFFRPMLIYRQPINMRRFIPILFPLWFLLSVCGASTAAKKLLPGIWKHLSFATAAAALAVFFLLQSFFLFREPLYAGIYSQMEILNSRIPKQALIIIPDSIAGLHLQLPLEFAFGRDALLLPAESASPGLTPNMTNYIRKQLQGNRPVVALTITPEQIHGLFRSFDVNEMARQQIQYRVIRVEPGNKRPSETEAISIPARLYRIEER